jgi:hypothetical protein
MDELEDSPEPEQDTQGGPSATGSPASKARAKVVGRGTSSAGSSVTGTMRSSRPPGSRAVDQMTIEEIEALPAAKRRKSLKARGAAGPGRGWRKGLKMDQKPVYVAPGESPPTKVASGTPNSFVSRPRSSLARDALSKTSTPFRSESPYSRSSPNDLQDTLAEGVPKTEEKKQVGPPAGPTRIYHRSMQPVLPLAKIPIGFATVHALDKSGKKKPVRLWKRQHREVVSFTGKAWNAVSWVTTHPNMAQMEKQAVALQMHAGNPLNGEDSSPSTPEADAHLLPSRSHHEVRPSPLSNHVDFDWRGSSAAFTAAVKPKKVFQ